MNPSRVIYEDAPAFIPVPAHMQHHRVEAIFWPLDEPAAVVTAPPDATAQAQPMAKPAAEVLPLSQLVGKAKGCFDDTASVDAFIRAGRDEWAR